MKQTIQPSGPGVDSATRQVFSPADSSELDNLIEEDRGRVAWKQDFEYCYGVHWPVRHITAFMATDEVAGSVSHRSTVREGTKTHAQHFSDSFTGRHLLLEKCGDISEFPARQALVDRLNKGWRKDLGGHSFNAAQSNIYSGPLQADDTVSLLDHIGFHKDGRCKIRGPPIISGCYSNVLDKNVFAAFLIHHQQCGCGFHKLLGPVTLLAERIATKSIITVEPPSFLPDS